MSVPAPIVPDRIHLVDGHAGGEQALQATHHGRRTLVACERRRALTAARSPFSAASCSSPPATRSATAWRKKGRIASIADATTHGPRLPNDGCSSGVFVRCATAGSTCRRDERDQQQRDTSAPSACGRNSPARRFRKLLNRHSKAHFLRYFGQNVFWKN